MDASRVFGALLRPGYAKQKDENRPPDARKRYILLVAAEASNQLTQRICSCFVYHFADG